LPKKNFDPDREFNQRNNFQGERIEAAKNYLRGDYLLDHQTNKRQAWYLGWWEILGMGWKYDRVYPEEIKKVTAYDLVKVLKKYFGKIICKSKLSRQNEIKQKNIPRVFCAGLAVSYFRHDSNYRKWAFFQPGLRAKHKNVSDFPKQAWVRKVVDGDTVILDSGQHLRYLGIDTPETRQKEAATG